MSEIGKIGAIYEDRRTKKQGKLLERDNKFKTLLMEASDGKSFNITFGSFKSNWRKVDEPEQTVEEAMQEVELTEEKPKKKAKPKVKDAEGILAYEDIFNSYVESLNSDKVSLRFVPAKGKKDSFVVIKIGKSKFIDLYLRQRGHFWIMMPEFVYSQTKWKTELINVVNTPKNRREISCSITWEDLNTFLEDIRHSFVEVLSAKVEEG
jgi:hypothetical protein